ncbi:NlpC/P60 family protein [Hominifimenecus sp. rT4P-3]|uniref:NlpC/P60 family protein n=1 Tax=Hominifimenecus sp. rT4P-3 TaxID=3242979 RepID=UPI003DA605A0
MLKDVKKMQGVRGIVVGMAAALTVTGAVPVYAETEGAEDTNPATVFEDTYGSSDSLGAESSDAPESSSNEAESTLPEASTDGDETTEPDSTGDDTSENDSSKDESGDSSSESDPSGSETGGSTPGSDGSTSGTEPSSPEPTTISPTETLPAETPPPLEASTEESTLAAESSSEETLPEETVAVKIFTPGEEVDLAKAEAELPVNLSPIRKKIAMEAYSLVGRVGYFWGGKSLAQNWDGRWGGIQQVTIEGSKSTGTFRSFGLDCSGFVAWVYVNAFGRTGVFSEVGETTVSQWGNSYEIDWSEVLPGDLVFRRKPSDGGINHVGVVVKSENGEVWVAHCASSKNNVVITDASRFVYARRPYLLKDECSCTRMIGKVVLHDASCKEYTGLNTTPGVADPKAWESAEQLKVDLQSLFPDASFAGAIANAIWDQYAKVPRETAGRIAQEAAAQCPDIFDLAREIESRMAVEPEKFELTEWQAETLLEFIQKAELTINASGQPFRDARRKAEETGMALSSEVDDWTPIRNIEGIQYLRSARKIDLSYNEISSLSPLDYTRTDAKGKQIYAYSRYLQNPLLGLWMEDLNGEEHLDGILRLYFGGGVPGSMQSYETVLCLTGNQITEAPEEYPGRLFLEGFPAEEPEVIEEPEVQQN